jgi:hypothetical protein
MIHGGLQIDQRLVAQPVDHAEQSLVEIAAQILAFGEGAHAQGIAVRGQHGYAFADVLRGGAVHDGVQPCLELPGALARGDDEGLPPRRAMPAWNEASVRSEGLKNTKPKILPPALAGSACPAAIARAPADRTPARG